MTPTKTPCGSQNYTKKKSNNFVVVTPNFNTGKYLAATIESVLKNMNEGDQYFVIDGGSSDNSTEILNHYSNRLTGWVSERDRGYADAIRKGFAKGSGKYQCWINSGDLLLNGALDLARTILDDSGADMIFGDDFYIDDNDNIIRYSRAICHDLKNHMLYGDWTPLQDACFWRTEIYQRAGGIDPTLLNAADFSLFAKISTIGDIKYAPFAFSAFRRHDQQKSILHHSDYKIEKEMVRKSLLLELQHSAIKKTFLRIIYFLIVRWKIRVLQHIWNLPELHGISINKIDAGSYAPHALMK